MTARPDPAWQAEQLARMIAATAERTGKPADAVTVADIFPDGGGDA